MLTLSRNTLLATVGGISIVGGIVGYKLAEPSNTEINTAKQIAHTHEKSTFRLPRYNQHTQNQFQAIINKLYPNLSNKYSDKLTALLKNCDEALRKEVILLLSKGDISPSLLDSDPNKFLEKVKTFNELAKNCHDSENSLRGNKTPLPEGLAKRIIWDTDLSCYTNLTGPIFLDLLNNGTIPKDLIVKLLNAEKKDEAQNLINSMLRNSLKENYSFLTNEMINTLMQIDYGQFGLEVNLSDYLREVSQDSERIAKLSEYINDITLAKKGIVNLPDEIRKPLYDLTPREACKFLDLMRANKLSHEEATYILGLTGVADLSKKDFCQRLYSYQIPIEDLVALGRIHADNKKIAEQIGFSYYPFILEKYSPEYASSILKRILPYKPNNEESARKLITAVLEQDGERAPR